MKKDMDISALSEKLPACCDIAVAPVESYSEEGRARIAGFMTSARTAVVLGHHINASLEWLWFPFESERGGSTCAADLHAKAIIEKTERILQSSGHRSLILPYPDSCGIAFKQLAAGTRMGMIGDSHLFLHRNWGPWVHLRVLLTDAMINDPQASGHRDDICKYCGKCVEACPGMALKASLHDQRACSDFQLAERERLNIRAKYRHKCEACVRACPVGEPPLAIVVGDKVAEETSGQQWPKDEAEKPQR